MITVDNRLNRNIYHSDIFVIRQNISDRSANGKRSSILVSLASITKIFSMSEIDTSWSFGDRVVRHKELRKMVSITDLWKTKGCPTPLRPDKWIKTGQMQEKLSKLAIIFEGEVDKDKKGNVVGIPGVLQVVRGGRYSQGTFASYDLGLEYAKLLSDDVYQWLIDILSNSTDDRRKDEKSHFSSLRVDAEEFKKANVRVTLDGRISVFDGIGYTTGLKNPHHAWNGLLTKFPEVLAKCENFQFPGQGQKPTPVATLQVFLEILTLLPGRVAATVREKAVSTLIRAMNGDPTLVEEIMDRISNPDDLRSIEESAKARRITAYGEDIPSGTIDKPLLEITPEIKNGYGWVNKTPEMIDLLVDLATHVGDVVIQRDSPHRAYSKAGKGGKSRIIPLTLKSIRDLKVLHIYWFDSSFVDDTDVVEVFQKRAYPEVAYRDFKDKGIEIVVANLISPGGITKSGVERLCQIQKTFDSKYGGKIQLSSMRLDELVWGFMYPAIAERYQDANGKFATHNLNMTVKSICEKLCKTKVDVKTSKKSKEVEGQLTLFDLVTV